MKKLKTVFGVVLLSFCTLFSSCDGKEAGSVSFYENAEAPKARVNAKMMSKAMAVQEDCVEECQVSYDNSINSTVTGNGQNTTSPIVERKLIKNGDISIEVEVLTNTEEAIEEWAKSFGGYVSNSSSSERNSWFSVKIPSKSFDEAMNTVGNLGLVKNRNIYTDDVSEQFYDLQTRLSTKKMMRENFQRYLSQATNLSDTLKIERELNSVISEIESMEGRLKRLTSQIEFSTINVNLSLAKDKQSHVVHQPTFGEKTKEFFQNVVSFFESAFIVLCYVLVIGIPVLAVVALLFWLLFGKVGLIKKLFRKLK